MPSLLGPLLRHVAKTTATIWVETDAPCSVEVLGCAERTFRACGHHYALVRIEGLSAGRETGYEVRLDGVVVWPLPGSVDPPSTIRTLNPARGLHLAFGSCRFAPSPGGASGDPMGADALGAWPDLLALLGDQVCRRHHAADPSQDQRRRGPATAAGGGRLRGTPGSPESWSDPEVRWLLSTVPTVMIFDDHDVHDDWNASRAWRSDANGRRGNASG